MAERKKIPSSVRRGSPKGDKRLRTKAKLLDAALALTREKGFEVSVQEIAGRAGMTTGALYGNFGSREALFMALAERQWQPVRPKFRPGSSFAELMTEVANAVIEIIPQRRASAPGAYAFRGYALKHEEIRARFRDRMAEGYESGAAWFAGSFPSGQLPMAPEILVRVINAMIEGLLVGAFMTPELVGEREIRAAFASLAR